MGSESIRLPIIDFSSNTLKRDSPTWESVKAEVVEALQDFGGFEATFDDIPPDLRKTVLDGLHELFDLPIPTKRRNNSKTGKPYHGYIEKYSPDSIYESLGVEDALAPGEVEAFARLMWPQGNPTFSKSVELFSEKLYDLDKLIRWMVAESFGLEKYMDTDMDKLNYLVRFQKYDEPHSSETKLGLPAHTDKGFVTILFQNMVSGLEFLTKDGQWITAATSVDSFIVLIGDAYHAWTNGRLHPPSHRVMMAGDDQARRSIGLFTNPKTGCLVKAPEEMVDEEHPLLYKPFVFEEYIDFYYTVPDPTSPDALKKFCGV